MSATAIPVKTAARIESAGHFRSVSNRHAAQSSLFRARQNLKDPVACHRAVSVNNRPARAGALNRHGLGDVEVADDGAVIISRPGQRINAGRNNDRIGSADEVGIIGLHDRRSQAAFAVDVGADAVGEVGIRRVVGRVDREGRRLRAGCAEQQRAGKRKHYPA